MDYIVLNPNDIERRRVAIVNDNPAAQSYYCDLFNPIDIKPFFNYAIKLENMTIVDYFRFIEIFDLFEYYNNKLRWYFDAVKYVVTTQRKIVTPHNFIKLQKSISVDICRQKDIAAFNKNKQNTDSPISSDIQFSNEMAHELAIWVYPATEEDVNSSGGHYKLNESVHCGIAACELRKIIHLPLVLENDQVELNDKYTFISDRCTVTLYDFIWGIIDSLDELNVDPKERI